MRHKPNILRIENARAQTTEFVVRGRTRVSYRKRSHLGCGVFAGSKREKQTGRV